MTNDDDKPPRVKCRLTMAPKVRDMYWCDFPKDAQLPEFWKRRPVIVIATDRTLSGAVTVVPCSSQEQIGKKWAFRLTTTIDGAASWAICDKPTTVAVSRLTPDKAGKRRASREDFTAVMALLYRWLPKSPALANPGEIPKKTDEEPSKPLKFDPAGDS